MKRMRKCNDEVYQLAKDQALITILRLRVAIRRRKCPTIQQKNEWTQK